MSKLEFCAAFRRENLNERFNGKQGKGDKFDKMEGRLRAEGLLRPRDVKKFVLLGKAVASCFDYRDFADFITPYKDENGVGFFILPHPSGINVWWNTSANKTIAGKALQKFCL